MKEKNKKPKCKGVWKLVSVNSVLVYKCTKCGKRLSYNEKNAVDHMNE